MKIVHIAYRYLPKVGGAEIYLDQLRAALAPITERQVIYQADPGIEIDDPDVIALSPVPLTPYKLLNFNLALLKRRWEIGRFDIAIIHNPEHLIPFLGARRTILVSHGATWTHEADPGRRRIRRSAMERAFKRATAVVANDSFVPREMGIEIASGTRFRQEIASGIWFVPNAIDVEDFARPVDKMAAGAPALGKGPLVLVPRNLTRSRGIDLAIDAFARSSVLPPDSCLVVTGGAIQDMPESVAYAESLRAQAASEGIAERVQFLGGADRAAMKALYHAADLTLVPTRYSEGTSLAAIESMACATATITTGVEGLLDLPGPHCAPDGEALRALMDQVYPERGATARRQQLSVRSDFDLAKWTATWRDVVDAVIRR
jgi:glycosyltransferase involved in cell wall biosynthesis